MKKLEINSIRENLQQYPTISRIISSIAFGDAMGLPWKNLPARCIPQDNRVLFDMPNRMVSDDTEHALFTLAALTNPGRSFEDNIRERFQSWVKGYPPSLGGATLQAGIRSVCGVRKSGVRSQGNGALTRAVVIGAAISDPIQRIEMVNTSTLLTHNDPVAYACAQMTAEMISARIENRLPIILNSLGEWMGPMESAIDRMPLSDLMISCGVLLENGVTGHAPVTLAIALQRASVHQQVEDAVISTVALGGDVDSAAALAGAFAAASGSNPPINWDLLLNDWVWSDLAPKIFAGGDWPRNLDQIRRRNMEQFGWILKLMFGMRLKARLS